MDNADEFSASDSASTCSEPHTPMSASSVDRGSPSTGRYQPYDRANGKRRKTTLGPKTSRKIWSHAFEKTLFNVTELTTLGVTQRRPIYVASLEAHIDRLHSQLRELGMQFFPVTSEELGSAHLKGLHATACKGMVSSLHHDIMQAHGRLLELQRANERLEANLYAERQ
ncbi:Zinc/cadmium resistance protein [Mycena sanguinolenta]|uniref:Zinc/cadmium resistance protein n=1 Tax=Mycena sanguinolenta TaxID=230812 RepID=A0A8H6XF61_9AGAR|nr:Zinc/cadmium resistance protein [Mycena sanguinolenta]